MAIQECAELRILADVRRKCSVRHIFVEIDMQVDGERNILEVILMKVEIERSQICLLYR